MTSFRTALLVAFVSFLAVNAAAAGDAERGAEKASACASCHGPDGAGFGPNPAIAGMDAAYMVEQLKAFRSGDRANPMMNMAAGKLTDQEIDDLAAYYATK